MQSYNFDKIREIPNNISGVYSIVNSLNNNRYIGSSIVCQGKEKSGLQI